MEIREHHPIGREYLALVTTLLQRSRAADPTSGLWEAADLQWWWRRDQHRDPRHQTVWLDHDTPVAAVVLTDWTGRWACDLLGTPGDQISVERTLWPRALEHIEAVPGPVELTVGDDDVALRELATQAGFEATGERHVTLWMPATDRAAIPPLAKGFDVVARSEADTLPHPMIGRSGELVEVRLGECSLYQPDLDLAVYRRSRELAGYGLFWADPVTGVGLVEPMRTEDAYQGRGLAHHLLAVGLDRLAARGCMRLKVSYEVGNEAARRLYLGAGFRPDSADSTLRRR